MEGMGDIQRNIQALHDRLIAAAHDAADESAHLLESHAKQIGPWTDRTQHLRGSIKGSAEGAFGVFRIVVSESMEYAPFVEIGTRRSRPYPALWPTVAANVDRVQGIFQRHMKI